MTDNEIIKALECCFVNIDCTGCPGRDVSCGVDCLLLAGTEALDLINRQKAEIDRLGELLRLEAEGENTLNDVIAEQQAEIERLGNTPFCRVIIDEEKLRKLVNEKVQEYELDIKAIQAEAIKEFAERLKNTGFYEQGSGKFVLNVTEKSIDNLVKEMTD
jgi:hypothetical protein